MGNRQGRAALGQLVKALADQDLTFVIERTGGLVQQQDARVLQKYAGDGKTLLSGQLVVGGKYEISELVAPAGYKRVAQKLTIQVTSDGQLKAVGIVPAAFKSEKTGSGSAAITVFTGDVWNSPTKMYIQKSSAIDGLLRLPGATYQLTGAFADGSSQRTLTTDNNGMAELDRALLVADGATEYALKETVAPEGYALNAADFVFTVSTDGSIVAKGEAVAGLSLIHI